MARGAPTRRGHGLASGACAAQLAASGLRAMLERACWRLQALRQRPAVQRHCRHARALRMALAPTRPCRRQNTGDRLRHSFGRQHSQLARAVSTYQRNFGIPEQPQHLVAAGLVG